MNTSPRACASQKPACCDSGHPKRYRWRLLLFFLIISGLIGIIVLLSGYVLLGGVILVIVLLLAITALLSFLLGKTARIAHNMHRLGQQQESLSSVREAQHPATCGTATEKCVSPVARQPVPLYAILAEDMHKHAADTHEQRARQHTRHVRF